MYKKPMIEIQKPNHEALYLRGHGAAKPQPNKSA
jgi:hypothetical protein